MKTWTAMKGGALTGLVVATWVVAPSGVTQPITSALGVAPAPKVTTCTAPVVGANLNSKGMWGAFREKTRDGIRWHEGLDIYAHTGTVVHATADGVVIHVDSSNDPRDWPYQDGWGRIVVIRHVDKSMSVYAHLSAVLVSQGQSVKMGQEIAKVGTTGNASWAWDKPAWQHLHFEIGKPGSKYGKDILQTNPAPWLHRCGGWDPKWEEPAPDKEVPK